MNVKELISRLQAMPQDSYVRMYSEGCCLDVDIVYESNDESVILTSNYETIEDKDYFPKDKSIGLHRNRFVYFQDEYKGDLT